MLSKAMCRFFLVFLKIHFPVLLEDYILINVEIAKRLSRSDANHKM